MSPSNHPIRRFGRRLLGHRRTTHRPDVGLGRRATDREPPRGWRAALLLGLAVALLDWTAKALIAFTLPLGEFREVVADRVAFWHVRNPAMVLGLWEDLPLDARKAIAVAAAVLGGVVLAQILGRSHRFPRHHRRWSIAFVGLVTGGMLGNLGERALHWGVTDYLSFRWGDYWLPPGNLADVALFLSFPLAVMVIAFELRGRARRGTGAPALARPAEAPVAGD